MDKHPVFERTEKTLGNTFGLLGEWLDQYLIPYMDRFPTTMVVGGIFLAFCAIGVAYGTGVTWLAFVAVPAIAMSVATILRYDSTH